MKLLNLSCLFVGTSLLTGCISSIVKNGDQVVVTERFFGLNVTATSATTATPAVKVGYGSSTITITPTSTTGPLYTIKSAQSFDQTTGLNPFGSNLSDSLSTGDMRVSDGTNAVLEALAPYYISNVVTNK